MKKLKIISLCFLISLLFIPKAYARTDYNFVTQTFSYIDNYLSRHSGKTINDFYDMILSNINYEPIYSNYICNISSNGSRLDCFSSNGTFTLNSYYSSGGFLNLYNSSATNRKIYDITFNSSGEYLSSTVTNYNLNALNNVAYAQPSSSSKLWSLPIASNLNSILFDNSSLPSSVDKVQNLKFNNLSTSYANNTNVPLSSLSNGSSYSYIPTNKYGVIVVPSTCSYSEIGKVLGIREFDLTSKDVINKDSPVVEHSFIFYSPTSFPTDYYDFSTGYMFPENDYTIYDDLNCVASSDATVGTICELKYYFTTNSDEDINVGVIFSSRKNIPTYDESLVSDVTVDAQPPKCNFANVSVSSTVDTSDSIDVIQEQITNGNLPSNFTDISGFSNLIPSGPIDAILLLPLNVLNSVRNFLSGTCTPLTINLPFVNRNINIPCIDSFYNDIGINLFVESVGTIASVIMLLNYFIFLYNYFDGVLRLEHYNVDTWGVGNRDDIYKEQRM